MPSTRSIATRAASNAPLRPGCVGSGCSRRRIRPGLAWTMSSTAGWDRPFPTARGISATYSDLLAAARLFERPPDVERLLVDRFVVERDRLDREADDRARVVGRER